MAAQTLVLFRSSNTDVLKETSNSDANKIVIVRKKPKTVSVAALVSEQISKGGKKIQRKEVQPIRGQPAPLAVARRNARERNRVRQVNNGFAALRQHIPDEVAEAFEGVNAAKGANKKLSKVETLRMAVEYIRSLENLLNISEGKENCLSTLDSFPSPASSSSPQDQSYYSPENDDEDSNPPTHSYVRIPGTNTYQLYPSTSSLVYEDDENIQPLTPTSDMILQDDLLINPHILDSSIQFMNSTGQEFAVIPPINSLIMPSMHNPMLLNEYSEMDEEEIDLKKEIPDIDGDDFDDEQHLGWWEQEEKHEDPQS